MDYRLGKCSSCGAEYKVPSSFAHDVARCKVCKGVVRLGPSSAPNPATAPAVSRGREEEEPSARPAARSAPAPKAEIRAPARAAASTPARVPRSTPVPRPASPRSNESAGESGEETSHKRTSRSFPKRPLKIPAWALIGLVAVLLLAAIAGFLLFTKPDNKDPGGAKQHREEFGLEDGAEVLDEEGLDEER